MALTTVFAALPLWVYAVLALLLALGLQQARPRQLPLRRALVMPLVLLTLSLAGVCSAFGVHALPLLAWALGLSLSAHGMSRLPRPAGLRFDASSRRFQLPGAWWPLALMLFIFALKCGAGFALALRPGLATEAVFAATLALAYGLCTGVFQGRALVLWRLAR